MFSEFNFVSSVVIFFDECNDCLVEIFGSVAFVESVVVCKIEDDVVVFVIFFFTGELYVMALITDCSSFCFCIVFGMFARGRVFLNNDGSYTCFSCMITSNSS